MIAPMLSRYLTRRIATLALALGMVFGAVAPGWAAAAMPMQGTEQTEAPMTMAGMVMQGDCMGAMEHDGTNKDVPRKGSPVCGMCMGCALPILLQGASLTELLYGSSNVLFAHDANKSGIATPPALPPPIA